jgi:hypothetical protein
MASWSGTSFADAAGVRVLAAADVQTRTKRVPGVGVPLIDSGNSRRSEYGRWIVRPGDAAS